MAAAFWYVRLIPTAVRVALAGGVTYGTVKVGAWSDSSDSREKLDKVQESIQSVREIEYPPMEHTNIVSVCVFISLQKTYNLCDEPTH